jgi:hypothetical protein
MDTVLARPLAQLLRDLSTTGGPVPEIRDEQWLDDRDQVTATLFGPDGSALGVRVPRSEPAAQVLASLADQVQEWAVEALWQAGRAAARPECPEHPGAHPLSAVVRGDDAVWICPVSNRAVGDVGALPG